MLFRSYGFGYFGLGFGGGRWDGGVFRYNTAVLNVNTTIIHNTYIDRTVIVNNTTINHISYNGGQGGITARPTPEQERAASQRHIPPVAAQQQHIQAARANPELRASQNQGRPSIAATSRPGEFGGGSVVAAREAGAPYHAPPNAPRGAASSGTSRPGETPAAHEGTPTHASDLQPHQVTPANTGNPKLDQKYQKEQQKLVDKQNKEHQQLQEKQQREDQAMQQKNNQKKQQQVEQRHQQQTQQLEQRHTEQAQRLQTRQSTPRPR